MKGWFLFGVIPVFLSIIIILLLPPKVYSDDATIILDKTFLENIAYPRIFHILFYILSPQMVFWLFP